MQWGADGLARGSPAGCPCAIGGIDKELNKTHPSGPSEAGARLGGQEHPTAPGAGWEMAMQLPR